MAKDNDAIEKIDEQLKKLEKEQTPSKDYKKGRVATGRRTQRGKHEHKEKPEELDGTREFKKIEKTDTKIFDAEEVKDEAVVVEDTTKVNKTLKETKKSVEEPAEITKENKIVTATDADEKEESAVEENEMSNTFVDEKPFGIFTQTKMKKEVKIIIGLLISIFVIGGIVGGVLFFTKEDKPKKVIKEVELTEEDKKKIITKYGEDLETVIQEELDINETLLEYEEAIKLVKTKEKIKCHEHEIYDDGTIYLNKCSINGIMTKYSYGEEKEITSNKLKVYVEKGSEKATLDKPSASKESLYDIYEVDCGEGYTGAYLIDDYVVYYDVNSLVQMRNFKEDKKALETLNYKEVVPIKLGDNIYDTTSVAVKIGDFFGIYKLTGEQIISPMYSDFMADVNKKTTKRNSISVIYGTLIVASDGDNYGVIDYTTNKTIIPFEFKEIVLNNNYVLATSEEAGRLFDFTGKEYFTGNNIYGNVERYFLIKEDNQIKLSLIDGNKLYEYGIINNIGKYYSSKVNNGIVTFQFLDTDTNGRCIEFTYNINDNSGECTRDKMCGIN